MIIDCIHINTLVLVNVSWNKELASWLCAYPRDERNGLFFFYEDWLYSYVSEDVVYEEIEI